MSPHHQDVRGRAESAIIAVLPSLAHELARLRHLGACQHPAVVTVVGKYNHGKSRLLNELTGAKVFAESDRRETVVLADHVQEQVRWLDAPGLDADVASVDDDHAHQAMWLQADIRLFVHAAKEGELDMRERTLLQALRADDQRTQRQTLCVLSQVDQLADEPAQQRVTEAIEGQVPGLTWLPVSSTRHRRGVEDGKKLMLEKSGIPHLQALLRQALTRVPAARAHEVAWRLGQMRAQLEPLCAQRQALLHELQQLQTRQRALFDQDLAAVLEKTAGEIQALLDGFGPDHSLTPDSFADQFKITPGKLARNRLQVAYSKACIQISAILTKHGVLELPLEQQTQCKSLDTVMVAVMGVSVKYRKDLQQMFCEPAGRARMAQDFTRYFESSADRRELVSRIARAHDDGQAALRALAALDTLEVPA